MGHYLWRGLLPEQIVSYRQIICNQLNNPDCVNVNLLTDKNIQEVDYEENLFC